MELKLRDAEHYYTIELRVPKSARAVRGILQLLSTLEKCDLRAEAEEALRDIKKSWEENFSEP